MMGITAYTARNLIPLRDRGATTAEAGGPALIALSLAVAARHRSVTRTCLTVALLCSMGIATTTARAADDLGSGPAASGGSESSGEATGGAGDTPDTGATDADDGGAATGDRRTPFFGGGLDFKPGFGGGCVSSNRLLSDVGQPGLGPESTSAATAAEGTGRYAQLSIAGSETFSDNINRSSDDKKSDFVTAIAPRLDACSQTGRFRGQLTYQLQGLIYANNSEYNHVYNDIQATTTTDLITNHLFLDVDTRYGQTTVDPSISYSQSNAIRTGNNQTAAWVSNVSPYLLQSLGFLGTGTARYRFGYSTYGDNDIADSIVNGVQLSLVSPASFDPFGYEANFESETIKRSGGNQQRLIDRLGGNQLIGQDGSLNNNESLNNNDTSHFDRASLSLNYRLSRTLWLLGEGGVENQYNPDGSTDRLSEPFWNAGFRFATARNSLEARIGHRFFGTTYELEANHRGRIFDMGLEYREEPTSQARETLNGANNIGSIGGGGLSGFGAVAGREDSLLDRGVYIERRVTANIDFNTGLTENSLTGYVQRRDYQQADISDAQRTGLDFTSRYNFTRRMTLAGNANWQHGGGGGRSIGGSYDNYEVGPTLVRALTPTAQAAVGYLHGWRRSDDSSNDYDENRVVLQFQKTF